MCYNLHVHNVVDNVLLSALKPRGRPASWLYGIIALECVYILLLRWNRIFLQGAEGVFLGYPPDPAVFGHHKHFSATTCLTINQPHGREERPRIPHRMAGGAWRNHVDGFTIFIYDIQRNPSTRGSRRNVNTISFLRAFRRLKALNT